MQSDDSNHQALKASVERTKLLRGMSLSDAEKFREGADLYDEGMRWLDFAIRAENPTFTDDEVDVEMERRKKIIRQIDDGGHYRPCGMAESDDEV